MPAIILLHSKRFADLHHFSISETRKCRRFAMEQRGLAVKDLKSMIGPTNRIYEILNRRRPLTLKNLEHALCEFFKYSRAVARDTT